ncbi:MAG: YkgJ family cysteine cluster protein [Permianibacter sp.]
MAIIRTAPCGPFFYLDIVSETISPCQACGACCATFRVSFYWAEADQRRLPVELIEPVNPWLACLRGTWAAQPRCQALQGEVGRHVSCTVYDARPDPCRDVQPGDEKCRKARDKHGLPPLAA